MADRLIDTAAAWQWPILVLGALSLALVLVLVLYARAGPRDQLRERALRLRPATAEHAAPAREARAEPGRDGGREQAGREQPHSLQQARQGQRQRRAGPLLARATLLGMNPRYIVMALGGGLAVTGALLAAGAETGGAILLGLLAGIGLPLYLVVRARARRLEAIEREFPAAIDIMVRGLRAGLPMSECMRLVAREADPELAGEFRHMVNEVEIGLSVPEAMQRMARRLQVPEIQLFATIVAIQSVTGGSLAKVLEAVGGTVRSRQTLRQKVVIMSNEARASATIIGALPVVLGAVLFIVSPEYIGLMFSTITGRWLLAGAVLWMLVGVQVMRKMIEFDV